MLKVQKCEVLNSLGAKKNRSREVNILAGGSLLILLAIEFTSLQVVQVLAPSGKKLRATHGFKIQLHLLEFQL